MKYYSMRYIAGAINIISFILATYILIINTPRVTPKDFGDFAIFLFLLGLPLVNIYAIFLSSVESKWNAIDAGVNYLTGAMNILLFIFVAGLVINEFGFIIRMSENWIVLLLLGFPSLSLYAIFFSPRKKNKEPDDI